MYTETPRAWMKTDGRFRCMWKLCFRNIFLSYDEVTLSAGITHALRQKTEMLKQFLVDCGNLSLTSIVIVYRSVEEGNAKGQNVEEKGGENVDSDSGKGDTLEKVIDEPQK